MLQFTQNKSRMKLFKRKSLGNNSIYNFSEPLQDIKISKKGSCCCPCLPCICEKLCFPFICKKLCGNTKKKDEDNEDNGCCDSDDTEIYFDSGALYYKSDRCYFEIYDCICADFLKF